MHLCATLRLARIIHESVSRDREDELATEQPQGVESEAYLNSTSQVSKPEDAREDDHIIRARYAPLSPASGFPVSRSQQPLYELSGLNPFHPEAAINPIFHILSFSQ